MASVTLGALWLNLRSDDSQAMSFQYVTALGSQPGMQISSATYADGNARMSWTDGYQAKLSVTLVAIAQGDRQRLELNAAQGGWLGELVWVRDDRGRLFCGYWDPPQVTEHQYNAECDVQLTLTQVYADDLL